MKNILIIGDPSSVWIKRYIEKILMPEDVKIYVADFVKGGKFTDFYNQNGITLIALDRKTDSFIDRIPKLGGLVSFIRNRKILKNIARYDIIQVHYVMRWALRLAKALKNKNSAFVVSYWGSDLFRKSQKEMNRERKYLDAATGITLSTIKMREKFRSVYGQRYDFVISSPFFGVSGFEDIDQIRKTFSASECKDSFGLRHDKLAIAIGYNKSQAQQHDKVLTALTGLSEELQSKIELVLHVGYGTCSDEYWQSVTATAEKLSCRTVIIDKFLYDEEVAKLRLAVDVFVNAQKTDAFSATMQEYIYAGAVVVNPEWLRYDELEKFKLEYIEYDEFSSLPGLIEAMIVGGVEKNTANRRLAEHTSWGAARQEWISSLKL